MVHELTVDAAVNCRHYLRHDDPVRIPRPQEHQFVGERRAAHERDVGVDHRGVEIARLLDELRGSPIGGHHNNSLYRDCGRGGATASSTSTVLRL